MAAPARPQAPEVGRMARILGPFAVTGIFWYRLHHWGVRVVPPWLYAPLVHGFTLFFFVVLRRISSAIASNLDVVLGPCRGYRRHRRVHRTLLSFAWALTERYESLAVNRPVNVTTSGEEHWNALLRSDGGFILITAHVGSWEAGAALASQQPNRTVHIVREEEMTPRAQAFLASVMARRLGERYRVHFVGQDALFGIRLLDALQAGEIVAMQGDRPRAGGARIPVRLAGRPYELPAGPLALARSSRVPLLPVFTLREGRRTYRIAFREPIHVASTGNRAHDIGAAATRLARDIEWAIGQAPHQWFCFRSLWPTPSGRR